MHLEDNPIEIIGDPTPVFKEVYQLYLETLDSVRIKFNNQTNFIGQQLDERLPESKMLDEEFIKQQMDNRIFQLFYLLLRDELTVEEHDWLDENDMEHNPNEMYIELCDEGELSTGIEPVGGRIFSVQDMFKIRLPVTKEVLENSVNSSVRLVYTEDGEFETEYWLSTDWLESSPTENTELIEYLFKTTPSRTQREAFAIMSSGFESILVAEGNRAVTTCSHPDRYSNLKRFPIDSVTWVRDEDDDDVSDMHFLYNTELTTEEKLLNQLEDIGDFTDSEDTEKFGRVLGYPEYAVTHFSELLDADIPAAYRMSLEYYYRLLTGSITTDEIETMEYVSYVPPLQEPHLTETIDIAESNIEVIRQFVDRHGFSKMDIPRTEYTSAENLPRSFEEIWGVVEEEPNFEL